MRGLAAAPCLAAVIALGCGTRATEREARPLPMPGESARALVGPEGGAIELGDATVAIPAGALAEEVEVVVTVVPDAAPSAFAAYSPIYRFGPAGQTFASPATVTLPFRGGAETATIFWTASPDGPYTPLRTTVRDGLATAEITHFSRAFVGSGCRGDDCCSHANGELDLLLVVDDSNSMAEEQQHLAEQIPLVARVLASGDLEGDGEQDFPALRSVRVGVVTTDMGTGGYSIVTCDDSIDGDDAVLRTVGNVSLPECEASYPAFAEIGAGAPEEAIDAFVNHVQCVALVGTGGCGFEQQLKAGLRALAPSTAAGAPGHGDGANAGFLRDGSVLGVLLLTDEEDCSTGDPELFNPVREDLGPLNVRCAMQPASLDPVATYVDGLLDLRENPDDVVFAMVAGVPTDLVAGSGEIDFAAILADLRMTPTVDPANPNELLPSCETPSGRAFPPRRMVEVASAFGSNGVVHSICQDDFTPAARALLERVAGRARGECRED